MTVWVWVRRALPYVGCILVYAAVVGVHGAILCPFTPDSLWYGDVARFLAAGQGLRSNITLASDPVHLPRPFYGWPPLYPTLCALTMRMGLAPLHALRGVSIASFILLPVPLLTLGSRVWGLGPACLATLSVPLWPTVFSLSGQALSEPLFLLLLAWALALLVRGERTIQHPIAAAFVLGLAGLTRLAGGIFLPALVLTLLWGRRPRRDIVFAVGVFLGTAGLWVARNSLATGGLSGIEEPPVRVGLGPVLGACVQRAVWEMLSVGRWGYLAARWWKIVVPALGLLTVVLGFSRTLAHRVLALWWATYLVGIAWVRTKGPFDSPSGGRTLAPALMLLAFWLVGNLGATLRRGGMIRAVGGILTVVFVGTLAWARVHDVAGGIRRGPPDCPLTDCSSAPLRLLEELAPKEPVLSNVAFKTAFCQNRPSVQLPIRPYSTFSLSPAALRYLGEFHGARYVYVEAAPARTTEGQDPLVSRLLRGEALPGLGSVLVDSVGVLYRLTAREPHHQVM